MYSLINKEVRRGGYIKGVKGKGMKEKREMYLISCPSTSSINKYNMVLTGVSTILKCHVLLLLIYHLQGWSW